MIGVPFIGIKGFGKIEVKGINLSPRPPAIIKILFLLIVFLVLNKSVQVKISTIFLFLVIAID